MLRLTFIFLSSLLFNFCFAEEGNFESGKMKSNICSTCHGVDGNSFINIWPKIAGQYENYLIKQLKDFRKGSTGERFDINMFGMVKNLSDQDILDLASFFSNQTLKISDNLSSNSNLDIGRKLYLTGDLENNIIACAACHGVNGLGNELANYPKLKGQHVEYIINQMKKFRSSERSNDINGIMRDLSSRFTDEQIVAVSNYISTIK